MWTTAATGCRNRGRVATYPMAPAQIPARDFVVEHIILCHPRFVNSGNKNSPPGPGKAGGETPTRASLIACVAETTRKAQGCRRSASRSRANAGVNSSRPRHSAQVFPRCISLWGRVSVDWVLGTLSGPKRSGGCIEGCSYVMNSPSEAPFDMHSAVLHATQDDPERPSKHSAPKLKCTCFPCET
jgi:hypothetical protein